MCTVAVPLPCARWRLLTSALAARRALYFFFLFDSNPNLAGVFDVYRAAQ